MKHKLKLWTSDPVLGKDFGGGREGERDVVVWDVGVL